MDSQAGRASRFRSVLLLLPDWELPCRAGRRGSFSAGRGDVLPLDCALVAHDRAPFHGERSIAVAMAEASGAH
jgi:hypothetical protein